MSYYNPGGFKPQQGYMTNKFSFGTGTDNAVASGHFQLNNAVSSAATFVFLSVKDASGADAKGFVIDAINTGDTITLQDIVDPSIFAIYRVTGSPTLVNSDLTVRLPVAHHDSNGQFTDLHSVGVKYGVNSVSTPASVGFGDLTGAPADNAALSTSLNGKSDDGHTHVLADITDYNPANFATTAQGSLADSALQAGDNISSLLNDVGFINDYAVTESDVTAHQAALSIFESQIADLGPYEPIDASLLRVSNIGVNVADQVHTHSIASVTGLQTALDGKQDAVYTEESEPATPATGEAAVFLDSSDGSLKVKFDTGTVVTIATKA